MNREEAQFILRVYRPNSEDAHDPQFKEALALVKQDPLLASWFAEEQAMDRSFAAKIRGFPTPPDLKAQLLLARTTGYCVPWWRRTAWLAAAASIALLLAVGAWRFAQRRADEAAFAPFRVAMAQETLDMSPKHYGAMGLDAAALQRWLTAHRGDADFVLPPKLATQGIAGCKVIDWHGHDVTLLCFKIAGQHADVFVVNASAFPHLALPAAPAYAAEGALTTATWQQGGKIYFVAGSIAKTDLEKYL